MLEDESVLLKQVFIGPSSITVENLLVHFHAFQTHKLDEHLAVFIVIPSVLDVITLFAIAIRLFLFIHMSHLLLFGHHHLFLLIKVLDIFLTEFDQLLILRIIVFIFRVRLQADLVYVTIILSMLYKFAHSHLVVDPSPFLLLSFVYYIPLYTVPVHNSLILFIFIFMVAIFLMVRILVLIVKGVVSDWGVVCMIEILSQRQENDWRGQIVSETSGTYYIITPHKHIIINLPKLIGIFTKYVFI